MSLLSLEHVSKRYGTGTQERTALNDVSLELHERELVGIWGLRRSGRSTLLRLAAGIEHPDSGTVRFKGRDLAEPGKNVLGGGVGYCRKVFRGSEGRVVLEELMIGQMARGVPASLARSRAREMLERAGAERSASFSPHELDSTEAVRVAIAQALASEPTLLIIDEPTKGVDLLDRDEILALLRSLTREGISVLMSAGESTGLFGTDRALSLSEGEMHGTVSPELAPVVRLRRRSA